MTLRKNGNADHVSKWRESNPEKGCTQTARSGRGEQPLVNRGPDNREEIRDGKLPGLQEELDGAAGR